MTQVMYAVVVVLFFFNYYIYIYISFRLTLVTFTYLNSIHLLTTLEKRFSLFDLKYFLKKKKILNSVSIL